MEQPTTRSTAELVMDVADDLRMLVRKEIELARVELIEGLRAQLVGAGMILVALLAILPALGFGVFALVFWLPFSPEVSFALTGAAMLVLAVLGALVGVFVMKRRRPRLDRSMASIKEDVRWAREQIAR